MMKSDLEAAINRGWLWKLMWSNRKGDNRIVEYTE